MIKHTFLSLFKDLKAFLGIKNERLDAIEKASATDEVKGVFGVNKLAHVLHPEKLDCTVIAVEKDTDGVFLKLNCDTEAPLFKAGQFAVIKGKAEKRFYPAAYYITDIGNDIVTLFIHDNACDILNAGDKLFISLPEGNTYYESLRDSASVYLCCDKAGVGAAKAFSADKNIPSVKIHVFSDAAALDAFMKEAAENDASVFSYGSEEFINTAKKAAEKNGIQPKYFRYDIITASARAFDGRKEFVCSVNVYGDVREIPCFSDEPLSVSLYNADIPVNIRCMSGSCGYCRMKLLSGDIRTFFPEGEDPVRMADKKYSFIHPCRSYPLSDISLSL